MFPHAFFRRQRNRNSRTGRNVPEDIATPVQTQFVLVLLLLGLFVVSAYYAWQELRYLRAGISTEATVLNIKDKRQEHSTVGYTVWYRFIMERDNKRRTVQGSDDISLIARDQYAKGQTIQIQYIAGRFLSSRIQGNGHPFWVVMFFVSLVLILAGGVYLYVYTKRKTSSSTTDI